MRLTTKKELDGFNAAIDACKGTVYLMDEEGRELDLKAPVSRCIGLGRLLDRNGDRLELFCSRRDDEQNFFRFFREYPEVNSLTC